jgi:hypothetical protein
MKKNFDVASAYDSAGSAPAGPAAGPASMESDYDSAPVTDDSAEPAPADDAPADLDIPAADVSQMQALKDKGDMAALGTYVSQYLK